MTDQVQWSNDATQLRLTSIENDIADLKKRFDAIGRGLESCLKMLRGVSLHLAVNDEAIDFAISRLMTYEEFAKEFPKWKAAKTAASKKMEEFRKAADTQLPKKEEKGE